MRRHSEITAESAASISQAAAGPGVLCPALDCQPPVGVFDPRRQAPDPVVVIATQDAIDIAAFSVVDVAAHHAVQEARTRLSRDRGLKVVDSADVADGEPDLAFQAPRQADRKFQTRTFVSRGTPHTAPDAVESVFEGGRDQLSIDGAAENRPSWTLSAGTANVGFTAGISKQCAGSCGSRC